MTERDDSPCVILQCEEIPRRFDLGDHAAVRIAACRDPFDALLELIDQGLFGDSLRLYPYVVPIRTAVWWALLCSWHGLAGAPAPDDEQSLRRVFEWIVEPTAARRRLLLELHDADRLDTAVDCCVKAACWAGNWAKDGRQWQPENLSIAARLCGGSAANALLSSSTQQLLGIGTLAAQGMLPWSKGVVCSQ